MVFINRLLKLEEKVALLSYFNYLFHRSFCFFEFVELDQKFGKVKHKRNSTWADFFD